jgi:hypothetical protein
MITGLTFARLINVLKGANQPVPEELLKFGTTVKKKEHGAYGAFYKDVDPNKKAVKITVSALPSHPIPFPLVPQTSILQFPTN